MQSKRWMKRGRLAAVGITAMLMLAACGGEELETVPSGSEPAAAPAAATEAVTGSEVTTGAEPVSDTGVMTEAEPATGTDAVTDTGSLTDTESVTGTESMTDGASAAGAESAMEAATGATFDSGAGIQGAEGKLVTASSLIDYTFDNQTGETIGDVSDIIIDSRDGHIPYLIIEYGGLLELGETQIPMALNAFSWQGDNDIVIGFDEAQLEQFPELDDEWFASTEWDTGVRGFWESLGFGEAFGMQGAVDPNLPANDSVSPAATGVPAAEPATSTVSAGATVTDTGAAMGIEGAPLFVRASDLLGRPVIDNGMGEGKVEELLLDLARGRVKYVLVNYADTVSDEEIFAIPFAAFDFTNSADGLAFGADFSPDFLTSAPRFNRSFLNNPADVDPNMEPDIERFWSDQGFFADWFDGNPHNNGLGDDVDMDTDTDDDGSDAGATGAVTATESVTTTENVTTP